MMVTNDLHRFSLFFFFSSPLMHVMASVIVIVICQIIVAVGEVWKVLRTVTQERRRREGESRKRENDS